MATLSLADYRRDEAIRPSDKPLPALSTIAILGIAQLYRDDPENALRLADESRIAFEQGRKGAIR